MMMTVVGLYDDDATARQAVKALKNEGYEDSWIHVESHGDWGTKSRASDLLSTLTSSGVPSDEAEFYTEGVRRGGSLLILQTPEDRADRAVELMRTHKPVTREHREAAWREQGYTGYDRNAPPYTRKDVEAERARFKTGEKAHLQGEEAHLQEAREELHVGKRSVERGGVRVHKRVTERPVEQQVRLHDERVDVEHRPATGSTVAGDNVFREETIELHERSEEPVVEKQTTVTGEVVVRKEESEHTETIRDTVRETEVDVERIGNTEGFQENRDLFRKHFTSTFGSSGRQFDYYEPAYQYGYAYGTNERFRNRRYEDAEMDLRSEYQRRFGKNTFEDVKDAIRYGYTQGQNVRKPRTGSTSRTRT